MGSLTRAERNIAWIEAYCRVPDGILLGQPVVLRDWQKDCLREIYDNPHGTRRAIISYGRKNGKTALAAMLLLLHLCGPEARANSELYSAARSRDQASVLFALAAKMVRLSKDLSAVITIRDTAKQLHCAELGTLYRALSAEAMTAYGLSPVFAVHDELGQVRGPTDELYSAIESASGAHKNPLSVIISTQAATDADLLSKLIDDTLKGRDPRYVCKLYTAPMDVDPFSDEAMKAANPALDDFLDMDEMRAAAEEARALPALQPSFFNLRLNQRVEARTPFVNHRAWSACSGEVPEDWSGLEVYAGLDLATVNDLAAMVMVARSEGKMYVRPVFWLPEDGLVEKSRRDQAPYHQWAADGFLRTTPGPTIDFHYMAHQITQLFNQYNIKKVGFDPWRFEFMRPLLSDAGMIEGHLERFEDVRQGWKTMTPALHSLESAILRKELMHDGHPVLTMCASNAMVKADPAGNRILDKAKSTGRIDGMVALAMAVSVAGTHEAPSGPSVYEERGLLTV